MRPLRSILPAVAALAMTVAVTGCGQGDGVALSEALSEAPPVEVTLAPELLAALQRDLGLTEDEAYARVALEAWAGQTVAALQEELGEDRYAGSWLTDDGQLMVAVTDDEAASLVRSVGAEPSVVGRGTGYLQTVMAFLDQHAEEIEQVVEALAGWYVDVSSNRVVVTAPPGTEPIAEQFRAEAGALNDVIEIVIADEDPQLRQDIRGGDAYIIADQGRCSVGFAVAGGYVTAGHCALAGVTTSDMEGTPQGEFVAASFPGVGDGGPRDWGVVAVYDGWTVLPEVTDYQGGTLPVAGSVEAPVGASVCRYGSTTGASCGTILAKNATVVYPEGTITGMTRTDACSEPGDSGGSWLSGDQAQGVTSGGSGDCSSGGITYYQPVNEILTLNQLTLITTGGEQGKPPPLPEEEQADPDACDGFTHTFRGQLHGPSPVGVEPSGRYYRALSAGTHTLCLAGPEGADFDLVLQQWDGEAWVSIDWSDGPTAAEQLSFAGDPGYYRIGIISAGDTGGYVVGLSFTRS